MALATRPKPNASFKKRQARHHRHSKSYVKAYWPYLPMLAIVGVGAYANQHWTDSALSSTTTASSSLAAAGQLTRIQALTHDQSGWALLIVIALSAVAFALFIFRHSYRLHRFISKGEAFASNHPWLDVVSVLVFTAGFILTRPDVFIA